MKKLSALLVVFILVLAGCAALPTSGPVYVTAKPSASNGKVGFKAQSPSENATPEEIVQGFLAASAVGFSDDFSVAREFLTQSVASKWNPRVQVRIYPDVDNQSFSRAKSGAVRFTASASATLDTDGEYQSSAPDSTIVSEFSLVRNAQNQWRIAALDDGVIMPDSLFSSIFRSVSVYFLSLNSDALVPVVYYFPEDRAATSALSALLSGPPSWLAGAVKSALPKGTALATPQVDVIDQVARVNLTAEAAGLHDTELGLMAAQVNATLKGLGGISEVQVSSGGAELDMSTSADVPVYPYGQYPLLGMANNEIHERGMRDSGSIAFAVDPALKLTHLAQTYDPHGPVIALGNDSHTIYSISQSGVAHSLISSHSSLVAPSTDRRGYVWSGAIKSDGKILATPVRGGPVMSFAVSALAGTEIVSVRVSRDGTRMVIVGNASGVSSVFVVGILRDANGVPLGFAEAAHMGVRLNTISDVAWVDASTLVVVGVEGGANDPALYSVPIFGPIRRLPGTFIPKSVTAGRGLDSVVAETPDALLEFDSGAWRKITPALTQPTFPG
ncbi:LpqB family beta-propeller domain-containing protein [Arcanobacterium canis]